MDIHTRIKERRIELKMLQKELARNVGVSQQTVQKWELPEPLGGTAPKRFRIKKVADQLKVTEEWLLTGNSGNLSNGNNKPKKFVFIPRYRPGSQRVKQHVEIPYLNDEEDVFPYRIELIQRLGLNVRDLGVVEVRDGSMNRDEQFLIDTSKVGIVAGQPYALETPAGEIVRRLFLRVDGQVILRADNPAFPEEVLPIEALHIAGHAVYASGVTST